jgi:hypothetical protein
MSDPRILSDRSWITSLAIGLIVGILLGFGTSLVFLLIIVGPLLGLGLALAGLRGGIDRRSRANVGGGVLIGMGSFYVLGALNTLDSCQGQDVCGGASALPLLGFAIVILAVGLLVEGITFANDR